MRSFITVITCFLVLGINRSSAETEHPTGARYVKHTFGRSSFMRTGVGAGIQEARNNPREWGRGAAGFGKRLASGFGEHVIKGTIEFGVATVRHEELGNFLMSRRTRLSAESCGLPSLRTTPTSAGS